VTGFAPCKLKLVECAANRGLLVRNVFEFKHCQRDAVDERHYVRAAVEMAFRHRELIDGEKFVGSKTQDRAGSGLKPQKWGKGRGKGRAGKAGKGS